MLLAARRSGRGNGAGRRECRAVARLPRGRVPADGRAETRCKIEGGKGIAVEERGRTNNETGGIGEGEGGRGRKGATTTARGDRGVAQQRARACLGGRPGTVDCGRASSVRVDLTLPLLPTGLGLVLEANPAFGLVELRGAVYCIAVQTRLRVAQTIRLACAMKNPWRTRQWCR